jgi:hypothetical protein
MNLSFVIQVKKYISISRSATVILKLPVAFSYGINVIFQSEAVANSRTLVAITAHVNAWHPGGQIPNYKNKYVLTLLGPTMKKKSKHIGLVL